MTAEQHSQDLSSYFSVEAIAQPGVSLDTLEKAIDAELAKVRTEPVAAPELTRAKNQFETGFVTRLESVPARAMMLNQYQLAVGDPGYAEADLARYSNATAASVQAAAAKYLDPDARVILRVVPKDAPPDAPQPRTTKKGAK